MNPLRPPRCPTCGQPWADDTPQKTLRVVVYRLPRLVLEVGIIGLAIWLLLAR